MPLVCSMVRPGDLVADIGASAGVYTYAFARRGAVVHAFEPQPDCVAVLQSLAKSTGSITVHPLGLGASAGTGRLVRAGDDRGPETRLHADTAVSGSDAVPIASLDELALGAFSLLKIDVEGAEAGVLAGAAQTLERHRPLVFVEIEQRHLARPIVEVFDFVESLGYTIRFLDAAGTPRTRRDFHLERDQDVRAIDDPRRVYINNFMLSHRDGSRRWFG